MSVVVRRDCSSVNTLAPCGGWLFSITRESAGESDSGTHDVVVGIRTRLQVDSDISDNLAVWLLRDDVVSTFPTRGPGTVKCTRRASLGDGEERVDKGKLVAIRNRKSEVPLLSLTRVSQPYAPITLQSSLALASIKTNRESLLGTRRTSLSKSARNASFCSRVLDTVSVGPYATTK